MKESVITPLNLTIKDESDRIWVWYHYHGSGRCQWFVMTAVTVTVAMPFIGQIGHWAQFWCTVDRGVEHMQSCSSTRPDLLVRLHSHTWALAAAVTVSAAAAAATAAGAAATLVMEQPVQGHSIQIVAAVSTHFCNASLRHCTNARAVDKDMGIVAIRILYSKPDTAKLPYFISQSDNWQPLTTDWLILIDNHWQIDQWPSWLPVLNLIFMFQCQYCMTSTSTSTWHTCSDSQLPHCHSLTHSVTQRPSSASESEPDCQTDWLDLTRLDSTHSSSQAINHRTTSYHKALGRHRERSGGYPIATPGVYDCRTTCIGIRVRVCDSSRWWTS